MYEYSLELKVTSNDYSEASDLGEFITEIMNMELEKWGVTFELEEIKEV